ncbi:hypothetical protein V2J09_023327 [Rumex salicifolius]
MRKPCCEREGGIINKGAWSRQEDEKLIQYIAAHGEGCWRAIPKAAGKPDIKRGNFDHDEEDLIIKLHALLGNRWSLIAGRLPGRTDNEVKNYWNSHLKKKLIRMGIDPNNHKPQQHLPRVITSHVLTQSSNSMEDASNVPPTCNNNDPHNNTTTSQPNKLVGTRVGAISNMVLSCVDDDETSSTPLDLNLDLTIAVTPTCNTQIRVSERKKDGDSSKVIRVGVVEAGDETSPTLSLFR